MLIWALTSLILFIIYFKIIVLHYSRKSLFTWWEIITLHWNTPKLNEETLIILIALTAIREAYANQYIIDKSDHTIWRKNQAHIVIHVTS